MIFPIHQNISVFYSYLVTCTVVERCEIALTSIATLRCTSTLQFITGTHC